jgi:hypothetical protein
VQALLGFECVDPDGLSQDMRGYGPTLGWRVPVEEQLEKVALGTRRMPEFQMFARIAQRHLSAG